jgi:hypothetical protein
MKRNMSLVQEAQEAHTVTVVVARQRVYCNYIISYVKARFRDYTCEPTHLGLLFCLMFQ